ncbi:hypothetical protein T4D_3127 [Trichinella pseudospiralis]|uniref:Uncharacterized protein n=1 Tax=Trichinella pseudospiralis TaxID=6337 RepID=A0A0V1FGM8_TRIPS|nr:hypothetical protein T4D_3127 [Trichinella pseudospiralis]
MLICLFQDHESRRVLINKLKHQRQFENTVAVCVLQTALLISICIVEQQLYPLLVHNHNTGHHWYGTQNRRRQINGKHLVINLLGMILLHLEVKLFFQLKVILYLNRLSFFVKAFLSNPSSS